MSEKTEQAGSPSEAASIDDRSQLLADLATEDRGVASLSSVIPEDAEHAASGAEDEGAGEGKSDEQAVAADQDGKTAKPGEAATTDEGKTKEREEKALRRADDEWKKIQAEKATLQREREAIEASKREVTNGPKAEDYERLAETYRAEGRDDMAKVAMDEASRVRSEVQSNRAKAATESLTRTIQANFAKACETDPDLQNPESDLYKRVDAVLKARPVFFTYPEGVLDVIGSAKAALKSERVGALESEVASLKQKLTEAEKKLQPTRAGLPVTARGSENINDIPLDKMRVRLLAELRGEDARA
jgi:hypothetical protein